MVGLPYPNIKSPELAEKMQYLNSTLVRCESLRQLLVPDPVGLVDVNLLYIESA